MICESSAAQQYKVLWSFGGEPNDGSYPFSDLVFDRAGNLYGTTEYGGNSMASTCAGLGCGTVFKLSPNEDGTWTNTVIYNFCSDYSGGMCIDGAFPKAGLIMDANHNLYGTTYGGGSQPCPRFSGGCGTVFRLAPAATWTENVLYDFCSNQVNLLCLDGALPLSRLTSDTAGNLYGTTTQGGPGGSGGIVFELMPHGSGFSESILHSFCQNPLGTACPDGTEPRAGVVFDKLGNLYGTTQAGGTQSGTGGGVVYRLTPAADGWNETALFTFYPPFNSGAEPLGEVSVDGLGRLYGTFSLGGKNDLGGIFRLSARNDGSYRSFSLDGSDGYFPAAGVLLDGTHRALYATTSGNDQGAGSIIQIMAPAQEKILYTFCSEPGCVDGAFPWDRLISDGAGNLYGTTEEGGADGVGVVFEITP
jgi:uncharacterized repeat protein (TIGR03803 family)